MTAPKIMIVVLDGLRPDLVTRQIMPVLRTHLDRAATYPESRCVFPSQTRVNATALGAGAQPRATGVVMNKLFDANVFADKVMQTGRLADVDAAEQAYGGRFIDAQTLGDSVHAAGLKLAVVSSASAGATHFVNPHAKQNGQISLCLRNWDLSKPANVAKDILERFGPIADEGFPNAGRLKQQTTMLLEGIIPTYKPDVVINWYNEPDWTQHKKGLGSPEAVAALQALDGELARLFTKLPNTNFIITSDHGHITGRERVDLAAQFEGAGFPFRPEQIAPMAASLGSIGGLWVRGGDAGLLDGAVTWLSEQPWCAAVFAESESDRVFSRTVLGNDHPRSPAVFYTMRSDDTENAHGIPGNGYFGSNIQVGGSFHGGPSRWEMNNLLALSGPGIVEAKALTAPAGICDIAPTVLHLLGLEPTPTMNGRILWEALGTPKDEASYDTQTCNYGGARRTIRTARQGGASYFMELILETEA